MLPNSTILCVRVWCTTCGYALKYQKLSMRTCDAYIGPFHTTRVKTLNEGVFSRGDCYHYDACFLFNLPQVRFTLELSNLRPWTFFNLPHLKCLGKCFRGFRMEQLHQDLCQNPKLPHACWSSILCTQAFNLESLHFWVTGGSIHSQVEYHVRDKFATPILYGIDNF